MKHSTLLILITTFTLFALTGCYSFFESKVPMKTDKESITLKDALTPEVTVKTLQPPTQVFASQGLYAGKIAVSWSDVPGAASYRLERAISKPNPDGTFTIPEESDFSVIKEFVYGTLYTDIILSNPSTTNNEYDYKYFYRVSSENIGKGLESSDFTDPLTPATQGAGSLLCPPQNLTAWKGKSTKEIKLNWDKVEGAAYYKIYRGEKENGTGMELIDTIMSNENSYSNAILTSDQGISFYYKIVAQNTEGFDSAYSSISMGYSLKNGAPTAPDSLKVTNGNAQVKNGLTITWNQLDPVEPTTTLTYSIYRTSSNDSVYTLLKNNIPNTTTTYTDNSSLKPGIKYYYYIQVTALDSLTNEKSTSAFTESGPESNEPAVGFILSAPTNLEIEETDDNKINILFTQSVGFDLGVEFKYNVKSSESKDGPFTNLVENAPIELREDGRFALVDPVQKSKFYAITAINSENMESELSQIVAPVPEAPVNVVASKTKQLTKDFQPNTNNVYPVQITWENPSGAEPAGYNIYRSTKPDSSFRKINDEVISGTTEYIDINETAKSGTFYYYKVISLNELGQGKKSNDPANDPKHQARGYGAITREQWFIEYNKNIMSSQAKLTLMHKANDLDKVGSETINGNISGTLGYTAKVAGLGAEITMPYNNYADHFIGADKTLGIYYVLNGNTDTTSNMSANGHMHEKVNCYGYTVDLSKSFDEKIFNLLSPADREAITATKDQCYIVGMYPGYAIYDNLEIKGGAAGGGYYLVSTFELGTKDGEFGKTILPEEKVDWLIGEIH